MCIIDADQFISLFPYYAYILGHLILKQLPDSSDCILVRLDGSKDLRIKLDFLDIELRVFLFCNDLNF